MKNDAQQPKITNPSNNLEAKTMAEIGVEVDEEMMRNNLKRCIYRVPGWLKDQVCDGNDKTPYVPEIVSFGPYHRGEKEVKEMEKHKWRCLRTMLKRREQRLDEYLTEMRKIEEEVRACYQGWYDDIDSEAFAVMLVLDGCFMLEFLRVNMLRLDALDYDDNDPVFSKSTIMHVIARDMIKLENQLPLMVLEKLLSLQYGQPIKNKKHIPKLVMRALTPIWITNQILCEDQLKPMRDAVAANPDNMMLHCLDIFRSSLLYKPPEDQVPVEVATSPANMILHCLNIIQSSLSYKTPEDQVLVLTREEVKMMDIASPIQIQTQVNDMSVPGQEEQPDPEMGRTPSLVHVSFDISTSSFATASAFTSSVPNVRFCSPDHSSSDEKEVVDDENMMQPTSCLSDVQTRIVNCVLRPNELSDDEIRAKSVLMVYCVEDLRKAGVKFKVRKSQSFWDLKFDKHRGLLEIPTIKIDDATKTVFLNLIAYEQCHLREFLEMSITDYVAFMDNLVNSASDVSHLHRAGIIVHQLGSDAEVADLFNRLVKKAFVSWKDGCLSKLYIELNRYCSHKRHRWRASWRNEYMKNPWVILSIIAAILLFGATLLQTFYTVFPYYIPAKS